MVTSALPGASTRSLIAALLLGAGAGLGLVGCASHGEPQSAVPDDDTPLSRPDLPRADAATEDLRKYIDEIDAVGRLDNAPLDPEMQSPDTGDLELPIRAGSYDEPARTFEAPDAAGPDDASPAPPVPPLVEVAGPAPDDTDPPDPSDPPEPPETPEVRLDRQVSELQATLHELHGNGNDTTAAALNLLALQLLGRDVGAGYDDVAAHLSPAQRRSLDTLRALLAEVNKGSPNTAPLDPQRLSELLREFADKHQQRPLRVTRAALCTSVESFGRYTEFPSRTFLQGRAQPVIVYVEVEDFAERAAKATPSDPLAGAKFNPPSSDEREKKRADTRGVPPTTPRSTTDDPPFERTVELTESIAIHTDVDDLVVWRAPDATIRDAARSRRDDYYLVQRVVLPPRLTLGKYNMKVTVTDRVSGAVDETVIPIEIVADETLVKAR